MFFCIFYFVLGNRLTSDKKIAIIIQNKYFVQYRGVKNRKFYKNSGYVVISAFKINISFFIPKNSLLWSLSVFFRRYLHLFSNFY